MISRFERDLSQLVVVQPDDDLMTTCAALRATGERRGHPLGQKIHEADRWIAATALGLDIDLVSRDAVFDGVPGLRLLAWAGDPHLGKVETNVR